MYAKENIEKPEAIWNNVLWTEETKQKSWRKNGDAFVENNILLTVGSIMLSGCVAAWGT